MQGQAKKFINGFNAEHLNLGVGRRTSGRMEPKTRQGQSGQAHSFANTRDDLSQSVIYTRGRPVSHCPS